METLLPFLPYDFNYTFKMFTVLPQLPGTFSIWGKSSQLHNPFMPYPRSMVPKALSGSPYPCCLSPSAIMWVFTPVLVLLRVPVLASTSSMCLHVALRGHMVLNHL